MQDSTSTSLKVAGAVISLLLLAVVLARPVRTEIVHLVDYIRRVGPADARICTCQPDGKDSVITSRNLTLPISIYRASESAHRGNIILVHGNTPLGRRHPFYRVLGRKLSQRGFTVLAPDLAGFGESDNPFSITEEPGYRFSDDVRAVVDSVISEPSLPGEGGTLILVGHSMGAVPTLRVGLSVSGISGVAAIGPPRRIRERMELESHRSYFWNRAKATHRKVYGRSFPNWFSKEAWHSAKLREAMENFLPALKDPGHVPVLFVDGSLEPKSDLGYLRQFVEKLAPPISHVRIAGSDHYANVRRNSLGWFVLYDDQAVEKTVDVIERWIASSTSS